MELPEADELEEDFLDMAWGVDPDSRLSCQVIAWTTKIWWLRSLNTPLIWCQNVTNRRA